MDNKTEKNIRKVLVSFLGTGIKVDDRKYMTARYFFPDGYKKETSFIAEALKEKYSIDTVILIGTVKSMWENVYELFGENIDHDYLTNLAVFCKGAKHYTPIDTFPDIEKIDSVLGDGGKAILVHYGLDKEELDKNSEAVLGIEKYLRNGDELYLDITHSFRSLPLMLMNAIIYLKEVSLKNISIKSISYGMLDVSREFVSYDINGNEIRNTPVVELNSVLDIHEWITGAYALKEFGDAKGIAEKLQDEENTNALVYFSNVMHVGIPGSVSPSVKKLSNLKKIGSFDKECSFGKLILNPVVGEIVNKLEANRTSHVQYKAAKWHRDHKNHGLSYLILQEAIISLIAENNRMWASKNNDRKYIRSILNHEITCPHSFILSPNIESLYNNVRKNRNKIAHSTSQDVNADTVIENLNDYLDIFARYTTVK